MSKSQELHVIMLVVCSKGDNEPFYLWHQGDLDLINRIASSCTAVMSTSLPSAFGLP